MRTTRAPRHSPPLKAHARHGRAPGAAMLLAGLLAVGEAASQNDATAPDEPMAVGISELCTTCNDVIRCRADADATDGPPMVVYNLLEDTFWQQVATIWDYLVQFIDPVTEDVRAMTVYTFDDPAGRGPAVSPGQQATVDAVAKRIALADGYIDMRSGNWFRGSGDAATRRGRCELLDYAAGQELIAGLRTGQTQESTP